MPAMPPLTNGFTVCHTPPTLLCCLAAMATRLEMRSGRRAQSSRAATVALAGSKPSLRQGAMASAAASQRFVASLSCVVVDPVRAQDAGALAAGRWARD